MKTISAKENIKILVSLMKAWGIRHVVVCPGSRNAPIVHTLGNTTNIECKPVTDERSAAFVALGMADALKEPIAVCCTSGSAVLNMSPAIAEAYYRQVPLLVISADRPVEWIGQMDGQTLVQPNCFSLHAHCYDIDEVHDDTSRWATIRNINEALMKLNNGNGCPIHINIHLSEPLFVFEEKELPSVRKIEYSGTNTLPLLSEWKAARKRMIILGQIKKGSRIHKIAQQLAHQSDVVCIAEHLSNLTTDLPNIVWRADDILANNTPMPCELDPDLVVYVGGHIVSKRLKQWLRKIQPQTLWHVSDELRIIDLFQCVSRMVSVDCFAQAIDSILVSQSNNEYLQKWLHIQNSLTVKLVEEWTDVNVVGRALQNMPQGWILSLGNSSAVRHAQHFALPHDTEVMCNRGVNGIDGSMSEAVGCALATERNVLCIVGDLSFFYDMNAIWNVALPSNLRILVLNNGGGSIFASLSGLEQSEHKWPLVAAQHHTSVRGWAESCGCTYSVATPNNLAQLFEPSHNAVIFEAFADKCGSETTQITR